MNPLITVIVPVYNTEKYLSKCVDSIINQTYTKLEIILVDDGSTDSSPQICDRYEVQDQRVKVIHKKNGGQATARNAALSIAKGEFIGFVDSDDYVDSSMYQTLIDAIDRHHADIAVCGRYNVNLVTGSLYMQFDFEQEVTWNSKSALKKLLIWDGIDSSPCDKVFSKELFVGARFPSGYICEDVALVYKLIDKASKIVHTGKSLYYYLQRQGSTSRSAFSEKTMGLVTYHKQVSEDVKVKYPDLVDEADYFYLSRLIYVTMLCMETKSQLSSVYKNELLDRLKGNYSEIRKNKYITKRDKIKAMLIKLHIYTQFRRVYKYFRLFEN